MRKSIAALFTAVIMITIGAIGTLLAVSATSQSLPSLNGSCIGPVEVLDAAQAAEGTANGITINGQYVPIEAALTGPQLYASTAGCAPDGATNPPTSALTTSTVSSVPTPTTLIAPSSTTTTTPTSTTSPSIPRPHIVCIIVHWHHLWIARCHRVA